MTTKLAGCIITDNEGKILLLHRNTDKWQHWEVPGGKVEGKESLEDTARREVEEEVGVKVEIVRKLGSKAFEEKDYTLHYTWFLAHIADGEVAVMEAETFDDASYYSLEDMHSMPLSTGAQAFLSLVDTGDVTL